MLYISAYFFVLICFVCIIGHLVELEYIEQFEKLPVLLAVLELDVVLLQTVQGQLGLIVDIHLHGILKQDFARC